MTLEHFTNDGWRFDVTDAGDPQGRCVVLLHGFPADRHCWKDITPGCHQAGYRTLAPDQRGYSPGARPSGRRSYRMAALVSDVLALADQAQADRVDVVGHDWGAAVAWDLAARHPDRVRSLTALSVPHPGALAQSLLHLDQVRRSWYMAAFQLPRLPEAILGRRQGTRFRRQMERRGLGSEAAGRYAQRAAAAAMKGPLNWYRGLPLDLRQPVGPVRVPSLFVWGDDDAYIGRRAAEANASWMRGPYRQVWLAGVSHWIPEEAASQATELLLEHLAAHRV